MIGKSYALLGHPIGFSLSQVMHNAAFKELGWEHRYDAITCAEPEDFDLQIARLREGELTGVNVTLPHKRRALAAADVVEAAAKEVGAANVLSRREDGKLVADNTDVLALFQEIKDLEPRTNKALVLGSGGGALAAMAACDRLGYIETIVTSRSWTRAHASNKVRGEIGKLGTRTVDWPGSASSSHKEWTEILRQTDLVIQATSAGMKSGPSPDEILRALRFQELPKHTRVIDLVYRPDPTDLVQAARRAGLPATGGMGMLVRQAEASFQIWFGQSPPPGVMRSAAVTALISARD